MLDVVSAVASLLTLIEATSQVVDFLSDLKDGGRERMRLLAEVTNFCCALDNLKELLEIDLSSSGIENKTDEKWTKGVRPLLLRDGLLDQCNGVVSSLEKRLGPKEGKARLIQHLRWPFSKTEVLQAVEHLHRLQTTVNNLLGQINISLSQQIRQDGGISRQILEDQKAKDIRSWLSPLDFAAQQEEIFAGHCPGTGVQFLQSEEFNIWKSRDRSTMWCYGIPGAGKTYLSSIVVNELQQHCELSGDITLAVYCRYDDPQCQSIANIAGDLLRQCIRSRQMPEALSKLFREHHSSAGTRPTCDALFVILSEHLGLYGKAYIVVDALDEIASADDRKLFLRSLRSIKANVSLLTMSRDFEDIRSHMGLAGYICDCCDSNDCSHCEKCPQYAECLYHCGECIDPKITNPNAAISFDLCQRCYEAGVRCLGQGHPMERMPNSISYDVVPDQNDLKRYLNWRIPSDSSLKMLTGKRERLQDQVFDAVVRSSGSMFLMAKLILDGLATCLTIKELKLALDDIPSGLRVAYDATMQRITDQGRSRSRRAFEVMKWVLLAKRPLRSAEMEHLVTIEHGSEDIDRDDIVPATTLASLCAGLVVIDDLGEFRFIHQTVPEYLEKNHSEKLRDADACLSECCLTYIRYQPFAEGPCKDVDDFKARRSHYPAYSYCTRYWYEHLVASGTLFQEQKQAALEFFQSEPHWRSANQETVAPFEVLSEIPSVDNNTRLHYAAFLDVDLLFEDLMDLDPTCLNRKGLAGESPLMVAARDGMLQFLRRLLEAGAEANALDNDGYSALHWAVWQWDTKLMDLLVGAPQIDLNIRVKSSHDQFGGESPLMLAVRVGNIETVTTLITAGADLSIVSDKGKTALHVAVEVGDIAVVGALLDNGMDVDLPQEDEDPNYRLSAVMLASLQGKVDILDIVLKHSRNVNLRSTDGGRTALLFAIENKKIDAVKLLLAQKTIEVDLPDSEGWTPLIYAASLEMTDVILDLVAHGANLNRRSILGETAVSMATWRNHTETVKTLLSFPGVDVNPASPQDGCTALHGAVSWGNAELVELLMSHGADLQIRDKFNRFTPLDYARYFNDQKILELLMTSDLENYVTPG